MKLRIFESQDGDCLLVESQDGKRILCDGGRTASMRDHVSGELAKLRKAKKKLDIAYCSHVDNDHITGILAMLEDELQWRIHDHRKKDAPGTPPPKVPRPPEIGTFWHNAFRDQFEGAVDPDDIESLLAAAVPTFNGTGVKHLEQAAIEIGDLATAVAEALKVSGLLSPQLLNIPVNRLPGHPGSPKLLRLRPNQGAFALGKLRITIVGPGTKELTDLKNGWANWLSANQDDVLKIRAQMKKKIEEFSTDTLDGPLFSLGDWNGIPPFKGVTTPNIASLMLMIEEDGKRILMTGDAQQDFVISGLEQTGFLAKDENKGVHLDVLKVQHHGSEHNIDPKFCRRVSADHYVFCGNGSHGNPELKVIDMIFESRLGASAKRTHAPEAQGRKFTFWFSTTSKKQKADSDERKAFAAVEKRARALQKKSKGKLSLRFNDGVSTTLTV